MRTTLDTLASLRVEQRDRPLAVAVSAPRFSWQIRSERRAVVQAAYRIRVWDSLREMWDSGWVSSRESNLIEYGGTPLGVGSEFEWEVASRLDDGTELLAASSFETAPGESMWDASKWITIPRAKALHEDRRPTPYLRKQFAIGAGLARARLHATAGGIFQPWLDGQMLSDADFAPGWTDYRYRVPFHTYDLTGALHEGVHTVGAILGDGWYSGFLGPFNRRDFWGDVPVFRAVLVLEYDDGQVEHVVTNDTWEGSFGAIQASDMLHGEVYDARFELEGWSAGGTDGHWVSAVSEKGPQGKLVAALIDAAGPVGEILPVSISEIVPGSYVVDFGQNFAGRVQLRATGAAGTVIRMRHSEILNPDGTLYTDNLRGARATDTFILAGGKEEEFTPIFTFHGFRYLELTGYPGIPGTSDITGIVVSSLAEFTGSLDTDNELVNQLHSNIIWSMRSNFFEVPMDCPQRDERLGWGGDAQVFSYASTYLADVARFHSKWMDDILDAQKKNGAFADIAPCVVLDFAEEGAAGYADAGVFVPWNMYLAYGDKQILEKSFEAAQRWVQLIQAQNPDLVWREGRQSDYGDWLATVDADKSLVATAYFARAVQVVSWSAEVLGRADDALRFSELHSRIASAYRAEFVGPDGVTRDRTQTAQVLGLEFGLLTHEQRSLAEDVLTSDIASRGHLTSGFLAIRHVMPLLSAIGRDDLAYAVLLREETPSWGYQVRKGLTTIGEHWDAWMPDGELRDPWMNSFNHFALGSVAEWLYRHVGGIHPEEPGYSHIRIDPRLGDGVSRAVANVGTPYGPISTSWLRGDESFELRLQIPPNTTATVSIPGSHVVEEGTPLEAAAGIEVAHESNNATTVTVGSGLYNFRSVLAPRQPEIKE